MVMARGDHVIFFDDCTVLDPNFFEAHIAGRDRKIAIAGGYYTYSTAHVEEGYVKSGVAHPNAEDSRGNMTKPAPGGWLWGLNMSFPLSMAIEVDGYDEKYDGQGGSEDCDFGVRLERAGCKIVHVPSCLVYQILDTHTPVEGFVSNAWPTESSQPRKQKERVLKDGIPHYANELLIQELMEDPFRVVPQQRLQSTLFEMRLNFMVDGYNSFPRESPITQDWRDGQPLEEI